ncbi:MAG: mechanosensitive ion channel family protein [Oscillospiraceae bacterium]|nr:mechanosensitive ion channel family protein [Oscillospiraceae bacterium]
MDFSFETFSFNLIAQKVLDALPKLIGAVAIIIIGFWATSLIGKVLIKALEKKNVDASIHSFLRTIVVWVLRFAVILSACSTLGFNLNSFIAAIGAAGVTAGIGLQSSIAQFASGIQILVNKPFKSGDFVELSTISGQVQEIKLMYTVFTTIDNKRVIVPNSHITSNSIINYNAEGRRRLDLTFSISYSDDILLAKQVLKEEALKCEFIYKSPEPTVVVKEHASSSITLLLITWCDSADYWTANYQMQENVKLAFDKNGINIPFNQLDVHVING